MSADTLVDLKRVGRKFDVSKPWLNRVIERRPRQVLTDVTDVNGGNTHFTYDASHRMLTMRFPNQAPGVTGSTGALVSNKYDSQGRAVEQTNQLGRKTQFSYAGEPFGEAGGSTTITDAKGNVIVQDYQFGELISETTGFGPTQAAN